MTTHKARAELHFEPTAGGGLRSEMGNPTPSLILVFPPLSQEEIGQSNVQLGAIVDIGEKTIRPGTTVSALLTFWSELGGIYATQGSSFRLWYAGRIIGEGKVLSVEECGA